MKHTKTFLTAVAIGILLILGYASLKSQPDEKHEVVPTLTHAQQVWKGALEWCESRGKIGAVNPKDRDGTPSYGSFQFKPSTLQYYAEKYNVPTATSTMDYATQSAVVDQMILHRAEIDWSWQFPDCVKRLGYPPRGV